MMPEIRKMNSACRTAPAKIHPKSRMTGSETSWIQRGMSSTRRRRERRRARSRRRFLLIGQCDLLELPRHHEAHAVPSAGWQRLPMADPCPRVGPAPAEPSARASGGGGSDWRWPCWQRQPSVSRRRSPAARRLLPSRGRFPTRPRSPAQPAPQTLATRGSLQLMVPINQARHHGHRLPPLRRAPTRSRSPPSATRATPGFSRACGTASSATTAAASATTSTPARRRASTSALPPAPRCTRPPTARSSRSRPTCSTATRRATARRSRSARPPIRRYVVKIAPIALAVGPLGKPMLRVGQQVTGRAHEARRRGRRDGRQPAGAVPLRLGRGQRREHPRRAGHRSGDAVARAGCRDAAAVHRRHLRAPRPRGGGVARPAPARGARPRPRRRQRRERRRRRRHHRPPRRSHPRERRRLHHARQPHLASARLRQLSRQRDAHRAARPTTSRPTPGAA